MAAAAANGFRAGRAASALLCSLDVLRDGTSRGFDPAGIGRDTIFLVRLGGALRAYRDACPHYGDTPMAWRKDAYLDAHGTRIVCHAHGAQFDILSGECLLGPCLGQALLPVDIDVDGNGNIYLMRDNNGDPAS